MFDNMLQSKIVVLQKIQLLKKCLEVTYNDVYEVLINNGMFIDMCVFKWVVILFTQDLEIYDCIMLWDRLFARGDNKLDFMCYVCCAVIGIHKQLVINNAMEEDFDLINVICRQKGKFKINEIVSKALEIETQMKEYFGKKTNTVEAKDKDKGKNV